MIVQMTDHGQIVIPVELRRKLGLAAGQRLEVMERSGVLVLRPVPSSPLLAARGRFRGTPLIESLLSERERDG